MPNLSRTWMISKPSSTISMPSHFLNLNSWLRILPKAIYRNLFPISNQPSTTRQCMLSIIRQRTSPLESLENRSSKGFLMKWDLFSVNKLTALMALVEWNRNHQSQRHLQMVPRLSLKDTVRVWDRRISLEWCLGCQARFLSFLSSHRYHSRCKARKLARCQPKDREKIWKDRLLARKGGGSEIGLYWL